MLRSIGLLGVVTMGLVLGPVGADPLWAADPPAAKDGHGADPHGGQQDIFGLSLDLAIWSLLVFLLLFFLLRKMAWKPILTGVEQREQNIRNALLEAQKARDEAARIKGELTNQLDHAAQTVAGMLDEARRDAQHTKDELVTAARVEIQQDRDRLRREIEMARDQALLDIWAQTAQVATQIASKAIRRSLNDEDHRRLIDEALADFKQAGAERIRK